MEKRDGKDKGKRNGVVFKRGKHGGVVFRQRDNETKKGLFPKQLSVLVQKCIIITMT